MKKKILASTVSTLLTANPLLADGIQIDRSHTGQNTQLDHAANGVSVVNIATPNGNGTSHNTYIEFNVPTQGVILNNSRLESNTQLSGYIYGNENIKDKGASLILNEVSGTNRSQLNGYLEVAGQSADVIVANPNGITVNGGGFINTPKATLTTGTVTTTDGKASFDIQKGDIDITGKGLDASSTSKLEIFTKALKLNAKLHANDLDVVTGVNTIDASGQVTNRDSDDKSRPEFSIDSTALGGIYANAISLRGTQKGVGVNLPIEILAQDRLQINADGQIIIGKAEVINNAQIKSHSASIAINEGLHASNIALDAKKEVNIHGNTGASHDLTLNADALNNSAVVAAGVDKDFATLSEGSLTLNIEKAIDNQGILYGVSSLSSKSGSLLNAEDAQILTSNLLVTATDTLDNKGSITSDTARITTSILLNSGIIESANTLDIEAYDRLDVDHGTLFSQNAMTLHTDHFLANAGLVQSNGTLRLDASTKLNLSNTTLYSAQNMTLTTDAFMAEQSFIGSEESLTFTTKQFNNSDSTFSAQGIALHANNFVSSNTLIQSTDNLELQVNGNILSKDDAFLANGNIDIDAQDVSLEGTTLYSAFENIWIDVINLFATNSGLEAKKELKLTTDNDTKIVNTTLIADVLTLGSGTVEDNNSSIVAGTQSTITTDYFKSIDASFFGENIAIVTDWFSNVASVFYSDAKSLLIDAGTIDNSMGLLSSTKNLTLKSNVLKNTNADIEAGGILDVQSASIELDHSRLFAGERLAIQTGAQTIDSNTKLLSGGTMKLDFEGNLVNYGEITSNSTLALDVIGALDNSNIINAAQTLTVRANTLNNQEGARIRGGGDSAFNISGDIVNSGFLTSSANLFLSAQNVTNYAGIAANNTLKIESANLYNYETVYSGGDMYLYVSNLLQNNANANLFSARNLTIAKDANNNRTNTIENLSAKIESQGDMNLYANELSNIGSTTIAYETFYRNTITGELMTFSEMSSWRSARDGYYEFGDEDFIGVNNRLQSYSLLDTVVSNYGSAPHKEGSSGAGDDDEQHATAWVEFHTEISNNSQTTPSIIASGKDMYLNIGTLSNKDSTISVANNLRTDVGTLSNVATTVDVDTFDTLNTTSWYFIDNDYDTNDDTALRIAYSDTKVGTVSVGGTSQILAGGEISGTLMNGQNGVTSHVDTSMLPTISGTATDTDTQTTNSSTTGTGTAPVDIVSDTIGLADNPTSYDPSQNITLPEGIYGIFVLSDEPTGPLIESNPEYTNYNNFISSDYLLERLGYNGMEQTRRLGDAMYETQLVRDAITAMTGQRFIGGAMSDSEQYTLLMENAVAFAKEKGLEIGKKPTAEQLANLTEDIVWLEEKTVKGVQVLAPVLYLAKDYTKPLNANIAATSIDLTIDGHLANGGTITTREDMTLHTGTLTNEKGNIKAGGAARLTAIGDIQNLSGNIGGGSVNLTSTQGNIINKTLSKEVDAKHQFGSKAYTVVEETANITSNTGAVVLDAKKNIEITAANVSAKTSIALNAKEDVTVKTIAKKDNSDFTFTNGDATKESTTHQQSSLKAGETLAVTSGNTVNLEAVNIDAKNTVLTAKNKVNITAVVDSEHKEAHTNNKDTFSESSSTDLSSKESVKATSIQSDNLIIEGSKGVVLESVNAKLNESAQITSEEGDVDFVAKSYTNATYHEEESSSFGGLQAEKTIDATSSTKLADSSTQAQNHIVVAGKNVNVVATDLDAKGTIKLDAKDNVNIVSGTESNSEYHLKEEQGISLNYSDGKATYAEVNTDVTQNSQTTNKASSLSSSTLIINSGQDTNVMASNISATVARVDAQRDFNVLNALDTTSTTNEHNKKELGVEFTLNKEEASIFAGYWEEGLEQTSNKATVASSNIQVGSLDVTSKNTNIIGSNVLGKDISIDSQNINVFSASSNTNTQDYSKSIKAGIEASVKQNLSTVVDTAQSATQTDNASAQASRALKTYDALQSFAEKPVTAGVNLIYEESSSQNSNTNKDIVASTLVASNSLMLKASDTLEVAGSDVVSANSLSIQAGTIDIHASEGSYTSDTSSESKNAQVGLYGTNMGEVTVGFQNNQSSTTGTYQRNAQILAGGTADITSTGDTKLAGANVQAANLTVNVRGDLTVRSLQDTQTIAGESKGGSVSANVLAGGVPTGGSVNAGTTSGEKAWVNQTTSLNGSQSVKVGVGGTTTLTGASITNKDDNGVDQGNLEVTTQHLVVNDIQDIDTYESTSVGVGAGSIATAPALNSVDYSNTQKDKEQITRATIGNGTLNTETTTGTLNRDSTNTQELTKDETSYVEAYASDKTLALATNPTEEINNLQDKLGDVGLAAHVEILNNLPSASKGNDGEGDLIDNTVGAVLDTLGDTTAGLIPNAKNDGGYVTQIATQLFGDNRAGIVVEDKSKMEALGLRERQPGDSVSDWDYEQVVMVKTEDGIKPLSEVENPEGLEQVIKYRTNPDKQLVIGDPKDESGNPALEEYKIRISEQDLQDTGIGHFFTNGMFNSHDTAVYNQQTQQGEADAILNYNQQHGVIGDLLESAQDALAVNSGITSLGTGSARQTGDMIVQTTTIRNGDITIGAHSQGTLMTQVGMTQNQERLSELVQGNTDAHLLVQYSGSPVNHSIAEQTVTDIYGGEEALKTRQDVDDVSDVFRSNVTPEDAVGSVLGYQSAGINSSENLGANMWESLLSAPRLFGLGDPSPHSYYPCVIGCGEENFIPEKGKYYTPNQLDEKGEPQSPLNNYYQENFEQNRDDGTKEMTIDMGLLSNQDNSKDKTSSMDISTFQGSN